jgi:hypothetical protein
MLSSPNILTPAIVEPPDRRPPLDPQLSWGIDSPSWGRHHQPPPDPRPSWGFNSLSCGCQTPGHRGALIPRHGAARPPGRRGALIPHHGAAEPPAVVWPPDRWPPHMFARAGRGEDVFGRLSPNGTWCPFWAFPSEEAWNFLGWSYTRQSRAQNCL